MNNIEETIKETIQEYIACKYNITELTPEIEDYIEEIFYNIKSLIN